MKLKTRLIFLSLAVLLFLAGCIQTLDQVEQEKTATLTLKYFDKDGKTVLDKRIEVKKGTNAFEAMKENVEMDFEMYPYGVFVKSIAGVMPPETYFLTLFVNGKKASAGISSYTVNEDTVIEWKTQQVREIAE